MRMLAARDTDAKNHATVCVQEFSAAQRQRGLPDCLLGVLGLQELALSRSTLWENGSLLRVRFLEGTDYVQSQVKQYAAQWTKYGNVAFEWVGEGDADIRISLEQNGINKSYIGTGCRDIPQDQPTMSLCLSDTSSDEEFSSVVLHEFGHALGFLHEVGIQPLSPVPWNAKKVYEFYGKRGRWTKQEIDADILGMSSSDMAADRSFDRSSVMVQPIPGVLTDNELDVRWNSHLSAKDKHLMGLSYSTTKDLRIGGYGTTNSRSWKDVKEGEGNSATFSFSPPALTTPDFVVGLGMLDMGTHRNDKILRINAYASPLSPNEFAMHLDSWSTTVLYNARASWLAMSRFNPDFQCGTYNITDERSWKSPGNVTTTVHFKRPFSARPTVLVGLSGFDIGGNWRCHVYVSDVSTSGFQLHIEGSGTTDLYSAKVAWIACPHDVAGVSIGQFEGARDKGWSGETKFSKPFNHTPLLFTAITKFDVDQRDNLRVDVQTEASSSALRWHIKTWDKTLLYTVQVAYLAVET